MPPINMGSYVTRHEESRPVTREAEEQEGFKRRSTNHEEVDGRGDEGREYSQQQEQRRAVKQGSKWEKEAL
jgi:hypothetical protein